MKKQTLSEFLESDEPPPSSLLVDVGNFVFADEEHKCLKILNHAGLTAIAPLNLRVKRMACRPLPRA